jgi:parallel beta-helix repeat protein
VKAEAKTLYVDGDNVSGPWNGTIEYPYQNVTNALEHAVDGDTIFVHSGTYYEKNMVIGKSVSLIGEDRDSTIIDASKISNVISIKANDVVLKDLTLRNSSEVLPYNSAIRIEHFTGSVISHNRIIDNGDGIALSYSSGNVISDNIISSNKRDGINFAFSGVNVISDNIVSSNKRDGVGFYFSGGNVISGNTVSLNQNYGMYLDFNSKNNTIYHNNFNINQVWSISSQIWSYTYEGNYWSNYTEKDLNEDGIGDVPYEINANNQDDSPLMGMFSDFNITLKSETYYVTVICNSTISDFSFEISSAIGDRVISFDVAGEDNTVGFCRIAIPTGLMNYSLYVLVDEKEVIPKLLEVSDETYACLYLTYTHSEQSVKIISSKTLHLYNELIENYLRLQIDLNNLNVTYRDLLKDYGGLLINYSQLEEIYRYLNASYQEHLVDYSENVYNLQNLTYIFAATTAIFLITTIYLSKHAHAIMKSKTGVFKDEK